MVISSMCILRFFKVLLVSGAVAVYMVCFISMFSLVRLPIMHVIQSSSYLNERLVLHPIQVFLFLQDK